MEVSDLSTVQGWIQIGTSAGFAGLVWYLLAVSLPKIQERFDATLAKQVADASQQRADLLADLKLARQEFTAQMALQRESCQQEMRELSATYERHIDRLMKSG